MRALILAAALFTTSVPAFAADAPKYSTATSTVSTLLADPAAKAVLDKFIPQLAQAEAQIGGQTLKQIQGMAPDRLPDKLLADIDAELAKIK